MSTTSAGTAWSIWLAVASAVLALAALGFTVAGYLSVRREAGLETTYDDGKNMRQLIARYMLRSKLWQTYLAVGLTAASVLTAAASNIVGALA